MMKRLVFLAPLAVLLLAGCEAVTLDPQHSDDQQPDGGTQVTDPVAVAFSASIGTFTKVSGSSFDEGDAIGISATAPISGAANVRYACSGGQLTASAPIYWAENQTEPATFMAVYPYAADRDPASAFSFAAAKDQSVGEAGNDLLIARAQGASGVVALPFGHAMSRVVVKVKAPEGISVRSVTLSGVQVEASVNVSALAVTAQGQAGDVKAFRQTDGSWTAIIAPQSYGATLVVETASGEEQRFPADAAKTLGSGRQVEAEVTLAAPYVPVAATYTYTIDAWQDAGTVSYTSGNEDQPEHIVDLDCNGEYDRMDYIGNGVYQVTHLFTNYTSLCYFRMDTPGYNGYMLARGFLSDRGLQDVQSSVEEGNAVAERIYYLKVAIPCQATITYDSYNERIRFAYDPEQTWETVGTASFDINLLVQMGYPDPSAPIVATLQRNKVNEKVYRLVDPFGYLRGAYDVSREGQLLLLIQGTTVSILPSWTGLQFAYNAGYDDQTLYAVALNGRVNGTMEDQVIHFAAGAVGDYWMGVPEGATLPGVFDMTLTFND